MPISDELRELYVTAPTGEYYVECLALYHVLFSGGVRYITNQRDGYAATLETGEDVFFDYVPFAAVPPDGAEQSALTMKVAIDNTSRVLMDELETLAQQPTDPISIIYRVYIQSDPSTVQNDPPLTLDILAVTATPDAITFTAGMTNLRARPFPSILYTTERFPGLKR